MADTTTARCACGWETTGEEDDVVAATIEHGRRLHNMVATREQVLASLVREPAAAGTTAAEEPS